MGTHLFLPQRGTAPQVLTYVYCGQTVAHLSYCWALVVLFQRKMVVCVEWRCKLMMWWCFCLSRSGTKWAHISCALWIPEVTIDCPDKMEPITNISQIPVSFSHQYCHKSFSYGHQTVRKMQPYLSEIVIDFHMGIPPFVVAESYVNPWHGIVKALWPKVLHCWRQSVTF